MSEWYISLLPKTGSAYFWLRWLIEYGLDPKEKNDGLVKNSIYTGVDLKQRFAVPHLLPNQK